ncbi:hypothetical protein [Halopolyspora algeriensis]|uniref:hypothetical protein n=1 Tax=Halopolyspora algeriensis TaxID=1500506 RepID=UPI000DF1C2B5|nr:hypothetical protein [Halopolyspora algeriensis]
MTEHRYGGRSERETEHRSARRLAEVFGDLLPETTSDERSSGERSGSDPEEWYRENRPPHHGS